MQLARAEIWLTDAIGTEAMDGVIESQSTRPGQVR